jgi:hypothetical protein
VSGIFLAGNLGTLDGEFGRFERQSVRIVRVRGMSDFYVVRIGRNRSAQRTSTARQVHDVRLSALFRVIE